MSRERAVELVVLADTHVPTRGRDLPAPVWTAIDAADVVVHAGDWCTPELLDAVQARSRRLIGCWGNNDGPELRDRLPETARATVGGLRLAVTHETGDARGREARCDRWFGPGAAEPADVVLFGHSHIPWDSTTPGGVRLLNPGSPTDRRRQPRCTYLTATLNGGTRGAGTICDLHRHDLPRRTP